tara:strand:- start:137 stop:394 length:258 start_codon:yes stop_codon:yes gene_type:complete
MGDPVEFSASILRIDRDEEFFLDSVSVSVAVARPEPTWYVPSPVSVPERRVAKKVGVPLIRSLSVVNNLIVIWSWAVHHLSLRQT